MKIKKINAGLSLLSTLALLVHLGYTVYAYLTFYYNPTLKLILSYPFMILTCLHAVFGMMVMFLKSDGTRIDLYPKKNVHTILQRLSGVLMLPLLILHINTFDLLSSCAGAGRWFFFALLLFGQMVFYGLALTHVAVSLTRAPITLGWLTDREKQKRLDKVIYVLCAVLFLISVFAVTKGELAMFLPAGSAQ